MFSFAAFHRFLAAVLAVSFVFVLFLSLRLAVNMTHGTLMENCPLMDDTSSFCTMNGLQHLTEWQKMFMAHFQQNDLFLHVGLFLGFFFLVNAVRVFLIQENRFLLYRLRLHERRQSSFQLFEAWSQWLFSGLLNPMVYQKVRA